MAYLIGVDGGGTSTIAVLADLGGNILGRGEGGPSNFQAVGLSAAMDAIRAAVAGALAGHPQVSPPVDVICLGLAGVDTPRQQELIRDGIQGLGLAKCVQVVNDAEIALAGGIGQERGVVVVAGTGSAAFGGDGTGRTVRVGGWGWILGDEGSAFDIGREGLRATVRALDGRGPQTDLVDNLIKSWKLGDREALEVDLRERLWHRYDVAQQAEWVSSTAAKGDRIAQAILREAGTHLGDLATAAIARLGLTGDFPITFSGGVFSAGELILAAVKAQVLKRAPRARFVEPLGEPHSGAIALARKFLEGQASRP